METEQNKTITFNIPLGQILFVLTAILAVLKVMGKINLNWLQVFAPIWIPAAAFVGVVIIFFVLGCILGILEG